MTNQNPWRRLVLAILALFTFLVAGPMPATLTAQASAVEKPKVVGTKHPFLWRIESKDGKELKTRCWLYGTMHLGDERLVMLPDSVEEARENADALYCEVRMDRMLRLQSKALRVMKLPRGERLKDKLSGELYERLKEFMKKRGVSMRNFAQFHVWAVNLNLAALDSKKLGYTKMLDLVIYKDAKSDDKEVGGLETMDEQIAAFSGLSQEDHIKILSTSLDSYDKAEAKGKNPLQRMLETYLTGDVDLLWELAHEDAAEGGKARERFMKRILDVRNVRMADRMAEKMTKNPDTGYFFAVGVLHYPGEMGVLKLLRAKGYKIIRISPPPKRKPAESRPTSRKLQKVGR